MRSAVIIAVIAGAVTQVYAVIPATSADLCPAVVFRGQIEPELSEPEKRLVCGDTQSRADGGDAWRSIPITQARFNLRNFLQDRGYHHPEFSFTEDGRLVVDFGQPTRISSVSAVGAPDELRIWRKRKVIGGKMTPEALEMIEAWVRGQLQASGFPCPNVSSIGDTLSGAVEVRVTPGPVQNFIGVSGDELPSKRPGILRRYDAFRVGDPFDSRLLAVTQSRVVGAGLVQSLHLVPSCETKGAWIDQEIVAGPPRLLSFGFGLNTEGLAVLKGRWKNSRIGPNASSLTVGAVASSKIQRIDLGYDWYLLDKPQSRFLLRPLFEIRHESETFFELIASRVRLAPAATRETRTFGIAFSSGPALEFFRTLRGADLPDSHFLTLDAEVKVLSHLFEYHASNPRTGYAAALRTQFSDRSLFSTVSAQRFRLEAEGLYNFRDYDPPLFVLGARGGFSSTVTGEKPGPLGSLPPEFVYFLGGSRDIRGFGRQELPASGVGGLTSLFADIELRVVRVLPAGIQPLLFLDVGATGRNSFALEPPVYWSPGVGVRWDSAIGVFRATLARGFPSDVPGHFQFFLSFGEEF